MDFLILVVMLLLLLLVNVSSTDNWTPQSLNADASGTQASPAQVYLPLTSTSEPPPHRADG